VRRLAFALAAVLAAVVLQTALLDRLSFPGGSAPDLVLVVVVTLALASGPVEGALIGFGAGLALDAAPPTSHLLGLSALVFCLVGYGCGLMRGPLERSAWLPLAAVAFGAAAGEALYALIGMVFGDPDITWQSVQLVLPPAVVYDIALGPFVLYAVARFGGFRGWAAVGARSPEFLAGREPAGAGLLGGATMAGAAAAGAALRDTRTGREPRLRASAARQADGWIGGHQPGPARPAGPWVCRRRPLHLSARGGVAGSAVTQPGQSGQPGAGRKAQPGGAKPVQLRLAAPRRGDGVVGGTLRGLAGSLPALPGGPGRASRLRGAAFRGSAGGSAGLPGGAARGLPRTATSKRLRARAFRSPGGLASGSGRGLTAGMLRPVAPPRLRARSFRGGPSALAEAGRGKLGRPPRLRLRGRRRDGVVGGGVLSSGRIGSRGVSGGMGHGRGPRGAAFTARRSPGAPGPLRSGRGAGTAPRFRGGRRWFGMGDASLPGGRRGSLPGSQRGSLRQRRGLGGRRRGFGGRRRGGIGGRPAFWRIGGRRTGGLP
jgi:rod shape-determining protein MreD